MRLLFAGDSITDADHLWEPGEDGLGNGFVHMISEALKKENAWLERIDTENKSDITIINSGSNGYRAIDLYRRFDTAVMRHKPDIVTLLIGVNEAGAAAEGMVTSPEEFRETYESMIRRVREELDAEMILMEPFLFGKPAYLLSWRPYFESLLPVMKDLARKYSLPLIHLHEPLNQLADEVGVDLITVDGIHLTEVGNRYLADCWLAVYSDLRMRWMGFEEEG